MLGDSSLLQLYHIIDVTITQATKAHRCLPTMSEGHGYAQFSSLHQFPVVSPSALGASPRVAQVVSRRGPAAGLAFVPRLLVEPATFLPSRQKHRSPDVRRRRDLGKEEGRGEKVNTTSVVRSSLLVVRNFFIILQSISSL